MRRKAVNHARGLARSTLLALLASVAVVAALAVVLLRPGKEDAGRKEADAGRKKRASRPADVDLVIEVHADGTVWCWGEQVAAGTAADSGGADEAEEGTENLRRLLSQLTQDLGSERDEKGRELSEARVRVECPPEVRCEVVQKILADCMAAKIRDLRFGEVTVRVPEEEDREGFPAGGLVIPFRRKGEIWVKLWVDSPDKVQVTVDAEGCSDADELARKLAALVAADPNRKVIIGSGRAVPFGRLRGVIEAGRRAGIQDVEFYAPSVPGGDWSWDVDPIDPDELFGGWSGGPGPGGWSKGPGSGRGGTSW